MKRMMAFLVAGALVTSSIGVTAYGSVFADINKVPWPGAATFIDQAQSLGLMNGYDENGKKYSKPKNNVTYCETLQMIYSIMKVYNKQDVSSATVTKWKDVLSAYNIPSWAHNATVYALENELIANNDLGKLRNGTENATREDVGVIFGKAMAKIKSVNNGATLSYKDKGQISSASVPYLALLNSMKIMVGDSENKFNPKSKINRAEMAVLSVKTYNTLNDGGSSKPTTPDAPSSGTYKGSVVNSMVLENGDIFLSVKLENGTGLNLFGKKSDVKVTFEKETVSLKDIGAGDTVTIAYSGETLNSVVIDKSIKGINTKKTFPLSDLTSTRITVKNGSKSEEYRLGEDVEVRVDDKKSSVSTLKENMKDIDYNVTLTFDQNSYVTVIEALKSSNNPLSGKLTYVSDSKVTIEVGNKDYDYTLSEGDISIKFDSKTVTFSTLKKNYDSNNYTVTLKLDSKGYVTGITIDSMEDEYNGTLTYLNVRRVEIKAAGETHKYDLDEDVDVYIDGKSKDLDDLKSSYADKAYIVSLEVDKNDVVTEIKATSKNANLSKGTLQELTSSTIKIKIDGKSYTYDLSSNPTIKIDDKSVSLSTLKSVYADYKYDIELSFDSKNKVTEIKGTNTDITKGILKDVRPTEKEVLIEAGGVNYTLKMASDSTIKFDGSTVDMEELQSELYDAKDYGETVNLTLTMSGSKISTLRAEISDKEADTVKGIIYRIDSDGMRVEKSSGSTTSSYTFDSDVSITLNGSNSTVSRLMEAYNKKYSDEEVSVTVTLNAKERITKVVAKVVDEDGTDEDDRPTKGNIYSVSTTGIDKFVIKEGSTSYTYRVASSFEMNFNLDDLDEDDYEDDIDGLEAILDDCDEENYDCYVSNIKYNSDGEVTELTVRDK